jgi:amino acid permease
VASLNGFAFICHPSISPMIKENGNQKRNHTAVYIGFGLTTVLYMLVGVLGALSIFGKDKGKGHEDIIDYFNGSFQSPLIGSLTFLYLFLISPIFPYVSKNQALELLPKKKRDGISNLWLKSSAIFGICWIPMNILFIMFETSPVIVIGFISTVMAFYITYFLPIYMTIKVGNFQETPANEEDNTDSLIVPSDDEGRLRQGESLLTEGDLQVIEQQPVQLWQKGLYLCILAYGVFILICELISLFA